MTTTDRDTGRKRILRELGNVDDAYADVGIFDDAGAHEGSELTVAQIGAVHEFGSSIRHGRSGGETILVPERSWLRSNHDRNASRYAAALDRAYGRIVSGKTRALFALTAFAERVASDVRRNITKLREPPLAESTIAAKGGKSNPLIDTGTMRNSVRGTVVVGGFERKVGEA